jgi:hypothetical protein
VGAARQGRAEGRDQRRGDRGDRRRHGHRPGRPLARGVGELTDDSALHDATYGELAARFTERQLISLAFLVGTYSLLSTVFGAFRMELDPGLDPEDFDRYLNANDASQKGT